MNATCLLKGHDWNGCTCARCGEVRDEGHVFDHCGEACRICGRKMDHDWIEVFKETVGPNEYGCVENVTTILYECRRCGKLRKQVESDFHPTDYDAPITEEDRNKRSVKKWRI